MVVAATEMAFVVLVIILLMEEGRRDLALALFLFGLAASLVTFGVSLWLHRREAAREASTDG